MARTVSKGGVDYMMISVAKELIIVRRKDGISAVLETQAHLEVE